MHSSKRWFDIICALFCLVLLAPVLAVIALMIATNLGRPVLFRHTRPGLHGRPFVLLKFRTMTDARDSNGNLLSDRDRLSRFGKFLRSTSLDELPELFNVLKGEMSLVGPRPLMMEYMGRYSPEQARRHEVLPGITGWAQVHGRNDLPWEDKFALDVWYVDHHSSRVDIYILLMTLWKVIRREGVNEQGHATASEFMGNRDHSSSQAH